MSANQSNLAPTGYDYVVAVTQGSMNATLAEYLYKGLPEVILCYIYDANNNVVPIEYNTLVANAHATDPFLVPNGTSSSDQRVQNLNDASFAFAIKAKLGLPPGIAPSKLPPIIALKPGQSNVTYTLMFSEFVATEIIFGPRGSVTWFNQSQPSGASWTFSGAVDLNFQETAFTNLPQEIQNRLKDLGDPTLFSVQQLYYDLNSSDLEQGFQFNSAPSNSQLADFMTGDFINSYWKALAGNEVLGYGAKQVSGATPSTLPVTDLNFFTPDAMGTEGAPLTLNYLCATGNDPLPDTSHAGFGWNWIEPGEESQYDGVAALNRNTFGRYLNSVDVSGFILPEYVASNCYLPSVKVTYEGGVRFKVNYQRSMTPQQAPTVAYPPSGSTILSYSYTSQVADDQAGDGGAWGRMKLSSNFDLTVSIQSDNQIVIVQHLVIYLYVKYLATSDDGNVVDKQITDTYSIGVDDSGQIKAALVSSTPVDHSRIPKANGFLDFWADVDVMSNQVAGWAKGCAATSLSDIPVTFVQDFIFPGGASFLFADAQFSTNQDLVSHITYAYPS